MNRKIVKLLALLALVGMVLVGCNTTTTTTKKTETKKEPYKIGAIFSVTGANAPLGEPEKKALLLLVDKLNKAGGVAGHQIEMVVEDDESDPAKAVAAVNKLITVDKVLAIIGGTGSGNAMAIKPIATSKKIPYISVAAGNVITDTDFKWTFRAPAKNSLAAEAALTYIEKTLKAKSIAILYDSNAFGQDGFNLISKEAPKKNIKIVAQEKYETAATDVTAQLTNIKASNPDVVVVWGTNPIPAKAVTTMKQLGMTQPFIGSHGIANKTFLTLAGDAANGVVFPSARLIIPSSFTDKTQKKVVDRFISDYKAMYNGEVPNNYAGHAYDAFYILTNALAKSGPSMSKLRDEIEKTKNFVGPDGTYNYTATNHDGLKSTDLIMVKVENGTWVQVK